MRPPRNGGEPPRYRPTLLDRFGPEGINRVRVLPAAGAAFVIGALAGFYTLGRLDWPVALVISVVLLMASVIAALTWFAVLKFVDLAGEGLDKFIAPSGSSTPAVPDYSYQDTLVMRGKVASALESYEAIIAASPGIVDARLKAADLYAREGANPQRAAELFREVQRMPGVPAADDLYASNRLVDLYLGALRQPGRAIVELRRITQRHPRSAAAAHAERAIAELKAESAERTERDG